MPYIIGIIILIALAIYLWPVLLITLIFYLIYKVFKTISKPRDIIKDSQPVTYGGNVNNEIVPKTSLVISKNIEELKNYSEDKQWQISISFRKSASKNFDSALFLAKRSQNYIETESEGQIIHQAFFDAKSYSDFETLYKLIKDWKSTFIMLNGELIDKKSMSQLNQCLGDKVRFKDPSFCFGASTFTENPFGCHRLMITPSQKPWWEYGNYNSKKEWIINKKTN